MARRSTVDLIGFGLEPKFDGILSKQELISTYNWYSNQKTLKDAVKYLSRFLPPEKSKKINKLPDWKIPTTIGWISRIKSNGGVVADTTEKYFNTKIIELLTQADNIKFSTSITSSIYKKRHDTSRTMIGMLEEMLDVYTVTGKYPNLEKFFTVNNVGPVISNKILSFYSPLVDEPDLTRRTKRFVKEVIKLCSGKQRKIKKKSIKELTSKMKYAKMVFTIKSVPPRSIIGAKECYLYNSKNKRLYYIFSHKNFIVDKSMIRNVDISEYKVVSQEKVLTNFASSTKLKMRNIYKNIKRKNMVVRSSTNSHRMNDDTIIIKVFK